MRCGKCSSERMASVSGKTDDQCFVHIGEFEQDDYVPNDMGIGGGNYLRFHYCLNCGTIKGDFPLPKTDLEIGQEKDLVDED